MGEHNHSHLPDDVFEDLIKAASIDAGHAVKRKADLCDCMAEQASLFMEAGAFLIGVGLHMSFSEDDEEARGNRAELLGKIAVMIESRTRGLIAREEAEEQKVAGNA